MSEPETIEEAWSDRRRLSEELRALLADSDGRGMTVWEIEKQLKGRGVAVLVVLMAAPFVLPLLPGASTPFGMAILFLGVRIALRREPWLPRFIRQRHLSPSVLKRVINGGIKVAERMERVVKPRMKFLQQTRMIQLIGVSLAAGGLFLALPLPVPFSNTLPAFSIVLLAAGMMERDGLLVVIGHGLGALAWGVLIGLIALGGLGAEKFFH